MFSSLLVFELRSHFRRPVTWLYVAIVFLLMFFAVSTDAVTTGAALGKVKKNSPFYLAQLYAAILGIGQIITSALVGTAVLRDYEAGVHELLFTTRVSRPAYLASKYLAALAAMVLVFAAMPLGAMIGTVMPWVEPDSVQAMHLWHYWQPYFLVALPGVFFVSTMLFAVGSLTRSAFSVYVAGILLLVGYSVADELIRTLDRDQLANLIDPFAIRSIDLTTRYWTPAEKNARTLPIAGFIGANRALWSALGAVLLLVTFRFVKLEKEATVKGRTKKQPAAVTEAPRIPALPRSTAYAPPSVLTSWWSVTKFDALAMLRSVPFLAIACIGLVNVIMSAWFADQSGQSKSWPMSWLMAESSINGASLFILVLLTFYAGELVWRERQVKLDQVLDASPVPTAGMLLGKVTALLLMLLAFATISMLGSMLVQVAKGYPVIDLPVYALYVYLLDFPSWLVMVALAVFVQALVPRKPLGHVLVILVWVGTIALQNLGYSYRLLLFGVGPAFRWSDLNGVGPYPAAMLSLHGYWLGVSLMIGVLALLVWPRGTSPMAWVTRVRQRFGRGSRISLAGGALATGMFGGLFYFNASVVNEYRTRDEQEALQVAYEQRWRALETLPVPRIIDVKLTVDLEPSVLRARAESRYAMVNRSGRAIDSVLVNVPASDAGLHVTLDTMQFDRGAREIASDAPFGVHLLRLAAPLLPGDTLRLQVVQRFAVRGYPNGQPDRSLVKNGTFFNRDKFPSFGYAEGNEIQSDELRRKYKLPLQRRGRPRTDTVGLNRQSFFGDADFLSFEATVSTDPDQIAMAPGYLQKEWTANGRRYFHYVMDAPMPAMFSVLSARWAVARDSWNGIPIEVYHHPTHTFNVARMLEASKRSLEFLSKEFGPYQHRQLRILEFPRYAGFAQSFPNTVPYSEDIGFVARVDSTDVEDTDLPYFVTAHEIAHQWFPYQRMPADVEGSQMLSESLSEYVALVISDRSHGRSFTQKFLRAELDRYLRGRAGESKGERPLTRVDLQSYIWYQKGSLALFALRDLIGEDKLHGAIRAYLEEGRYAGPPYATTLDLMRHITAATPDSLRYAITDYFETITLWDVKADSVTTTTLPSGEFRVTVVGTASKVRADSLGTETPTPLDDYIDVGVLDAPKPGARVGEPLAMRKVRVTGNRVRAEFVVKRRPARGGIDPYNLLLDRNPGDNTREPRG